MQSTGGVLVEIEIFKKIMKKSKFSESLKIQEMSLEPSSDHDSAPPNLQISLLTHSGAPQNTPDMTRRGIPLRVILRARNTFILKGLRPIGNFCMQNRIL